MSLRRSRGRSVVVRVIVATALGAAATGATLALLYAANTRLRDANTGNARAAEINTAASELRATVSDLADALRGVITTDDRGALVRWQHARGTWRPSASRLAQATTGDPAAGYRARRLRNEIASYIGDYADPVVAIAQISKTAASSSDANAEGATRLNAILSDSDSLARGAASDAAERTAAADHFAHQARVGALAALALTPILLVLLGVWLGRVIAQPLRDAVRAASAVAEGDFSIRLPTRRRDEFGSLARAFNSMTESLARTQDALRERAATLERSEKNKSELISMVSHEIRTPLASILGFSRLLLEREVPEAERRHYLRIVDSEATRLSSLVGDFLDAQLLEEGRFALRLERLNLADLLVEHAERLVEHGGTHHLEVHVEDPLEVEADRLRLAQVVDNLLSNAVKYAGAGTTVTVGARTDDDRARVWVDDEGPGVRAEHRAQLFRPFYRGEAPAAGIPGTGLGLAVSQRIVEAHAGAIGFEPLPNGARFWFELPLERRELSSR
ncbi:MAG TPA: HAMP domain-containing sensor histidine kinase [Gaiellaceae bacterium]